MRDRVNCPRQISDDQWLIDVVGSSTTRSHDYRTIGLRGNILSLPRSRRKKLPLMTAPKFHKTRQQRAGRFVGEILTDFKELKYL